MKQFGQSVGVIFLLKKNMPGFERIRGLIIHTRTRRNTRANKHSRWQTQGTNVLLHTLGTNMQRTIPARETVQNLDAYS